MLIDKNLSNIFYFPISVFNATVHSMTYAKCYIGTVATVN